MAEGPVAVLSEHPEGDFGSTGRADGSRAFSSITSLSGKQLEHCEAFANIILRAGGLRYRRKHVSVFWRALIMEIYPVDLDPEQLVRWIVAAQEAAPSTFRISARRTMELRDILRRKELRLGDEERDDLRETATIATLEIAPTHASDGWLLTVAVEDETGPPALEGEEKIDLGTFYKEFIRRGRGTSSVNAEVASAEAKMRLTHLLHTIETNRHAPKASKRAATKASG
jgi:hypothetical protein